MRSTKHGSSHIVREAQRAGDSSLLRNPKKDPEAPLWAPLTDAMALMHPPVLDWALELKPHEYMESGSPGIRTL